MRFLMLCLFLLLALPARASEFSEFTAAAPVFLNVLTSSGIERIGEVDLRFLEREIKKVQWTRVTNGFVVGSGKGRTTGVYLIEERRVFVNELALDLIPKAIYPLAALHEALGASGFDDEKYQLSLALAMVAKRPSAKSLFDEILSTPLKRITRNPKYAMADGGTSVGGGGDATALEFKYLALDLLFLTFSAEGNRPFLDRLVRRVLAADFECNWVFEKQTPPTVQTLPEGRLIVIPSVQWVMHTRADSQAAKIEMVGQVLRELIKE